MIMVVNGPLGSGKSETSWALLELFERAVLLEGDYLTAIRPFDFYDPDDLASAYELFRLLVAHHHARGHEHFILNWVFESPEELARLRAALANTGLPLLVYRLAVDRATLAERVRRRGRPDLEWELRRAEELATIFEQAERRGSLGTPVDAGQRSPREVARWIVEHARGTGA